MIYHLLFDGPTVLCSALIFSRPLFDRLSIMFTVTALYFMDTVYVSPLATPAYAIRFMAFSS